MKKIIALILSVLLLLSLCACNNANEAEDIDTDETSEEPVAGELEIVAGNLIIDLNEIDRLFGGVYRTEDVIEVDGTEFYAVTFNGIDTKDGILEFIDETMTEDLKRERYSEAESMLYEKDGSVYCSAPARGCGWAFSGAVTLSDETEDSFCASVTYDDYGAESVFSAHIVLDGESWKIASVEF